jgi:hypothetical protein
VTTAQPGKHSFPLTPAPATAVHCQYTVLTCSVVCCYCRDDIWAAYFVSRRNAYVVIDDYATLMGRVVAHWQKAIEKQVVKELDSHKDVSVGRGWVLGYYNNEEADP